MTLFQKIGAHVSHAFCSIVYYCILLRGPVFMFSHTLKRWCLVGFFSWNVDLTKIIFFPVSINSARHGITVWESSYVPECFNECHRKKEEINNNKHDCAAFGKITPTRHFSPWQTRLFLPSRLGGYPNWRPTCVVSLYLDVYSTYAQLLLLYFLCKLQVLIIHMYPPTVIQIQCTGNTCGLFRWYISW